MSARTDAIIRARAQMMQGIDLTGSVHRDLTNAALAHAGGSLDATTAYLAACDRTIDALCKAVERARIAVADEHTAARPDMAEAVVA
jgi:hypothetical protein